MKKQTAEVEGKALEKIVENNTRESRTETSYHK